MIRLLRHDPSVLREEEGRTRREGAVEFRTLAQMFRSAFTSSQHRPIRAWLNYLQKGGGPKKRFQYCVDPFHADTILYTFEQFKATSGGKHINPKLQDNVLLPDDRRAHLPRWKLPRYVLDHPSGLIPGGKDVKKGRHAVFFTAVNPMYIDPYREKDYDVTQPRIAMYKNNRKIHRNTVYWCNLRLLRVKDCSSIKRDHPLHNTLPAMCIEKVVVMKSGEKLQSNTFNLLWHRKELY